MDIVEGRDNGELKAASMGSPAWQEDDLLPSISATIMFPLI